MDGHDPHPVVPLGGGRGLRLGVALGPGGEEVEQTAQVASLARLELGRQPGHLANVGEAGLAGRAREHGQVVAGLADHRLDQGRQREAWGPLAQRGDRGDEAPQHLALVLRDTLQALRLGQL